MCLSTGVARTKDIQGAPYVQEAIRSVLGSFGPTFIAFAMTLFAFTTLLGNLYHCENALAYLNHNKRPSKPFMTCFHILCSVIIFVGAISASDVAWALADITMGLMALINIPCCIRMLSLMHISEPTRQEAIAYAVFCLKKKNKNMASPSRENLCILTSHCPNSKLLAYLGSLTRTSTGCSG